MKKYDNYKDSGIEWIGEIPEHWNVKKLKFISKICNGQDQKAVLDDNGIYPIYGSGGIFGKANSFLFDQPSVLLGRKGTIDKPQYVEEPFWTVDTSYYTKIKDGFSTRLFYYLCTTINFELYKYGSAIPSMTQGHLNEIKFSIPNTFHEQNQIANYLDRKTAQIDNLIAKKEQFISLLQEERTALINQAVTKGLDPKVKMKDSGIEWLGEIPEHWEVKKLKLLANIQGRIGFKGYTVGDLVSEGEGALTLGAKHINKFNQLNLSNPEFISWEKYYESPEIMVQIGDIILTQRGTLGKVVLVTEDIGKATINPSMVILSKLKANDYFLYYFFNSDYFKSWIDLTNTATAVPMISQGQLGNLKLVLPNMNEQNQIVNSIQESIKKIDDIIVKAEQEIELLKEYKTALISEVVTGKVDVRRGILN
ncbi:MAG: restriction endonuclease subunit S [Flavobacterium sp.]|nr:restriction endonuclease subunit S [Flavobacterium sp.]